MNIIPVSGKSCAEVGWLFVDHVDDQPRFVEEELGKFEQDSTCLLRRGAWTGVDQVTFLFIYWIFNVITVHIVISLVSYYQ